MIELSLIAPEFHFYITFVLKEDQIANESKISISLIGKCGERIVVIAGSGA